MVGPGAPDREHAQFGARLKHALCELGACADVERGVGVDLALDVSPVLAGGIDEDEIGLKPTCGVQRELIVVFFADDIFPGAFQSSPNEASDAGFVIDQEYFLLKFHGG